jgi:hypothetical protein
VTLSGIEHVVGKARAAIVGNPNKSKRVILNPPFYVPHEDAHLVLIKFTPGLNKFTKLGTWRGDIKFPMSRRAGFIRVGTMSTHEQ